MLSKSPIIVKGNNKGIRIIMDEDATVDSIKLELSNRLASDKHYNTNNNPIEVTFEGKRLTEDETEEILNVLKATGLYIKEEFEAKNTNVINQYIPNDKDGLFYIGNIKKGQVLTAKDSIVIIGDIEYGGAAYCEGNIVVIGHIYGYADSGISGRKNTFVYGIYQEVY